ncbi:MAG: glycosyltransferase [Rubritepida sp.]|nr:glycosyltransferase [Rubritepida sp.]
MIVVATHNFPPHEPVHVFAHRIRGKGLAELAGHPYAGLHRFAAPYPLRQWMKALAMRPLLRDPALRGVICDSWKSALHLPPTRAPVLVMAHGMEFPPDPSPRRAWRIRRALGRASVIVANSRHTAAMLAPHRPAGARVEIIPPPIAPQPEPTGAARAAIRALAGPGPLIAAVSRLEDRKGFDRVIAALPGLVGRHPGLRFLIAGEGSDRARLEKHAALAGADGRVVFLGRVEEAAKAALLAEADLFAMPARREGASVEGFGIAYLEAAWHGCPALAGREGGAEDAVADGVTGLICDGADPAAVAAGLAALLDDAPRRRAMGQAAAARVRAGFLWGQVLPRWEALLGGSQDPLRPPAAGSVPAAAAHGAAGQAP